MIKRYKKKPVEVEAIQWTGDNLSDVLNFTGKHPKWDKWFSSFAVYESFVKNDNNIFKILTEEGTMEASVGDYIIRGVNGEHYPCKPDIFRKTYDCVDGDSDKFHYYIFVFEDVQRKRKGTFVKRFKEKPKITKSLLHNIKIQGDGLLSGVFTNCVYLGYMTEEEYNTGDD